MCTYMIQYRERNSDTCHNIDEIEVIIQKKSGTKEMCLTTYETPRVSPSTGTQLRGDHQELKRGENGETLFNEHSFSSEI